MIYIKIDEMMQLVTGDRLGNDVQEQGFVVSMRADIDIIKQAVVNALHYLDIYLDNEYMLDERDYVYSSDQLDSVAQTIATFGQHSGELDKTIWFNDDDIQML